MAFFLLFFLTASPAVQGAASHKTLGLFGGGSFPKFLFGKAQFNLFRFLAVDYQASIGIFWTSQQFDTLIFFSRGEWSPYTGAGYQSWNFTGFSTSTNYAGVVLGSNAQANSITLPLGLQYVASSGFALDINLAGDLFVTGSSDLRGRVMPEANIGVGYFF